jgi:TonB family protein
MSLSYIIQTNLSLTILAGIYILFLNVGGQFNFKRAFLIIGTVASLLLPFISFQFSLIPSLPKIASSTLLPELWINASSKSQNFFETHSLFPAITLIYIFVAICLSAKFIFKFFQLIRFLKKSTSTQYENFTLFENPEEANSFSFFRWIFIGQVATKQEKNIIIEHELEHAKWYHSFDVILMELLKVAFWFNPIIYLLKKNLYSIHEFQADEAAIKKSDVNQYCSLLARAALQSADFPIANYFNNSLTLKRITMIKNVKTKLSVWRLVWSITLFTSVLIFMACQEQTSSTEKVSESNEILLNVDESAAPAGGMTSFFDYVTSNMKYPEQARKLGVEGKIFIEFTVNTDGSISDATVKKGIGAGCDLEALRIVKESPNWVPAKHEGKIVRQKMVLPIVFKLG